MIEVNGSADGASTPDPRPSDDDRMQIELNLTTWAQLGHVIDWLTPNPGEPDVALTHADAAAITATLFGHLTVVIDRVHRDVDVQCIPVPL